MKRREFVRKATAGVVGGTVGGTVLSACGSSSDESGTKSGAAAVQTRPRVRWRLVSSFPRSLDTIYGAAEVLADRVSSLTDGRFTIRSFPANELVPFDQVFDSVQKGTVAIGHSASYYYIGINEAFAFDCTIPFGLTARQLNAWLYHGDGMEHLRPLFADHNMINYPGGNTGVQMGGWFRREINSLSDLRGIKMRIPGLGGKVMDAMGVTVQVLAAGDIYTALERGALDATEWSGPYDDEKLGFYQVAKHYYYPGWWEPGPGLSFYINRDAFAKLPSDYQAALEAAAAEANVDMMSKYDARNPPALTRLLEAGVQLHPFPDDIMIEAKKISTELQEEAVKADSMYRGMYEAYTKFQAESSRFLKTSEQTFTNFAFG
ncbi:MAG: ABC transporter substrate-binding protein [Bacteroidetes bacterium]|nr:MAG: ABC transporter substrate-binding protein [Bacteroidota bacterium]